MPSMTSKSKGLPQMIIRPVGIVKNEIKEPSLVVKFGDLDWRGSLKNAKKERSAISKILVYDDFTGILDGIEDFSHILVVYWAHRVPLKGRSLLKAHPIGRKDFPLVGIFATCSPARPNNICIIAVRLLERKGNILKVEGLDAIDGSPVIDIKPYNPSYYAVSDVKVADWMEQIHREFAEGSFPPTLGE